jgi:transposase
MTCWRRLRDWHEAGVWKKLHELLLSEPQVSGWMVRRIAGPGPGFDRGPPQTRRWSG